MPRVVIDQREIEVEAGQTLLQAARLLGIDVPNLCWLEGCKPNTSCMVCVMKLPSGRFAPSCATVVEDGMVAESETAEVREVRKAALELLLSDHAGQCVAPCEQACPLGLDIPTMMRQVAEGRSAEAALTVRGDIALPSTLGRLCPEYCENACRRRDVDAPASICLLKRHVADCDLATGRPTLPMRAADSGKSVAIVGAGPAGLSAAYHLAIAGHACTAFEATSAPGGMLRRLDESQLPRETLEAEIGLVRGLGVRFELNVAVGDAAAGGPSLGVLRREFDAVLLAFGMFSGNSTAWDDLKAVGESIVADAATWETSASGVFAAGDIVRPRKEAVLAVAAGKAAAVCMDRFLCGEDVRKGLKVRSLRLSKPTSDEVERMAADAGSAPRATSVNDDVGLTAEQALSESQRCLQCGCVAADDCRLRRYAETYGADGNRYRGVRRESERVQRHGDVVFQPGKCILCGLCIQVAEKAGEALGFAFVGRGFDVRLAAPFDAPLSEALKSAARQCAEACPTGALFVPPQVE